MSSAPDLSHGALVDRLRNRFRHPLPGHAAHAEMAPFPRRVDPGMISVDRNSGRLAATLVLLFPNMRGRTSFVLTVRPASMRNHSGQVSLPGGSLEPGESVEDAARREAWEEVGVPAGLPDVLGTLTPLYIPPSGFSVWPVVASIDAAMPFVAHVHEVETIIEADVSHLLEPAYRLRMAVGQGAASDREVPCFSLGGHSVWGATAMMLAEFAAVVLEAASSDPDIDSAST